MAACSSSAPSLSSSTSASPSSPGSGGSRPSASSSALSDEGGSLLEKTGGHISILLKTVEEQLSDLSTDLLPAPSKKATGGSLEAGAQASSASSSHSPADPQRLHTDSTLSRPVVPQPSSEREEDPSASSSLETSPEERFNKNLQHVKQYYRQCFLLNHLLHTQIEKMQLLREGVCGHKIYNMALQVENLELLAEEKAKTEDIRKSLKWS